MTLHLIAPTKARAEFAARGPPRRVRADPCRQSRSEMLVRRPKNLWNGPGPIST